MKVLIFAGLTRSLISFRGELIRAMTARGHEVVALAPEPGYEQELAALGARFVQMPVARTSVNPFRDLGLLFRLRRAMKREKPDVYFGYTIKPCIYGSIAARLAGVRRRCAMITGLGSLFIARGGKRGMVRRIAELLYRVGLSGCQRVLFQNPDDRDEFVRKGLVKADRCAVVNGSGVDMSYYRPVPLPEEPAFLFVGSVMRDKGVCEYLQAARMLRQTHPQARCRILGGMQDRLGCLSEAELEPYTRDGSVEYCGETRDVRPYLAACRVFVLPSYREGTSRAALEAMACGRAVLTTDAPGCRQTVVPGENGWLVPPGDAQALYEKMCWMADHPEETAQMGARSLALCAEKYEVGRVNEVMLRELGL